MAGEVTISRLVVGKFAGCIIVFALLMFSFTVGFSSAQYITEATVDVEIPSSGVFNVNLNNVGVSLQVTGTPGATGSINVTRYPDNPQPNAKVPEGIQLTRFVVVTFYIAPADFVETKLVVSFSDADVQNIKSPFSLYKYLPSSDVYVEMPCLVDYNAKTITTMVTSVDDPLFAIGGLAGEPPVVSPLPWILLVVVVIIIVVVALLVLKRIGVLSRVRGK